MITYEIKLRELDELYHEMDIDTLELLAIAYDKLAHRGGNSKLDEEDCQELASHAEYLVDCYYMLF